jgi:hypothetical protein
MTTYSVKLQNAQQARQAILALCEQIKPHLIAGRTFTLEAFDGKSREQERLCHSCYRDLARDALLAGIKADADLWKESLKYAFYLATKDMDEFAQDWQRRKPRMVPLIDGDGFVMTPIESRHFTKSLYTAYITFLHATGDARGVNWSQTSLGNDFVPG